MPTDELLLRRPQRELLKSFAAHFGLSIVLQFDLDVVFAGR